MIKECIEIKSQEELDSLYKSALNIQNFNHKLSVIREVFNKDYKITFIEKGE